MLDIVNGKVRARKWPRSRGKPKTKAEKQRQDKFRAAQQASKYFAPDIMTSIIEATDGTPLLPRDITTMILYNRLGAMVLPTGRIVYPMPAVTDVSASLDVLGQDVGKGLVRTEEGWRQGDPGGSGQMVLIEDVEITSTTAEVIFSDLQLYASLYLIAWGIRCDTNTLRVARVSIDGGATYLAASDSYGLANPSGAMPTQSYLYLGNNQSSADPRYSIMNISPNLDGFPVVLSNPATGWTNFLATEMGPITNLRCYPLAGNFNLGRFILFGIPI